MSDRRIYIDETGAKLDFKKAQDLLEAYGLAIRIREIPGEITFLPPAVGPRDRISGPEQLQVELFRSDASEDTPPLAVEDCQSGEQARAANRLLHRLSAGEFDSQLLPPRLR